MIRNWVGANSATKSGTRISRPLARVVSIMDIVAVSEAVVVVVGSVADVALDRTVQSVVEEGAREDAEPLLRRIRSCSHLAMNMEQRTEWLGERKRVFLRQITACGSEQSPFFVRGGLDTKNV